MSNIKNNIADLEKTKNISLRKSETILFWGILFVWTIFSAPGFFNYLFNSIISNDALDVKSHKGVASIQYIGSAGKTKVKTLVVGSKHFECGMALAQSTKGCDGIPLKYLHSEVMVDYISIPWRASRVSNVYPTKITELASGHSVVLIKDNGEFLNNILYFEFELSIYSSIALVLVFLCIKKFFRYIESK